MTRTYKLFKISSNKEKLVKEYPTMQEATLKVRNILGLREFQKCQYIPLYDGNLQVGMEFIQDGKKVFKIEKIVQWEGENNDRYDKKS